MFVLMLDIVTNPDVYSAVVHGSIGLIRFLKQCDETGLIFILCTFLWILRNKLCKHIDNMEDHPIRGQEGRFANNYIDVDQAIDDLAAGDQLLRDNGLHEIVDSNNLTTAEIMNAISNLS